MIHWSISWENGYIYSWKSELGTSWQTDDQQLLELQLWGGRSLECNLLGSKSEVLGICQTIRQEETRQVPAGLLLVVWSGINLVKTIRLQFTILY